MNLGKHKNAAILHMACRHINMRQNVSIFDTPDGKIKSRFDSLNNLIFDTAGMAWALFPLFVKNKYLLIHRRHTADIRVQQKHPTYT